MTSDDLKAQQAPLKAKYREDPTSAVLTMRVTGKLNPERVCCEIETWGKRVDAGLHPAASGDMLLEALAGCAGVTLLAVATAMSLPVRGGTIVVEGDVDFRGTLGISKEVPVGFLAIRTKFSLDAELTAEQSQSLKKLCERYCVVAQSLRAPIDVSIECVPQASGAA
ncbi:MAG: OsmC family protein [Planctomycetota bacterium]|nr:OsmC family protein [Planctomycetota bacterium]